MAVEYRIVPQFPKYRVGNDGSALVYRDKSGEWEKLTIHWTGSKRKLYATVILRRDGKRFPRLLHHLVLELFVGPRPIGMLALHDDDDCNNNHVNNLKWGTCKENAEDVDKNGKRMKGEGHKRAKLTTQNVLKIRELRDSGMACAEIAKTFGMSAKNISQICLRRRWAHV